MHQNSKSENYHQTLKKGINNTTIRKGDTDGQTWRRLIWVAIFSFKKLSANNLDVYYNGFLFGGPETSARHTVWQSFDRGPKRKSFY